MAYRIPFFDTDYDSVGTGCMSLDYISYQLQCANGQDLEIPISSGGGKAFDAVAIFNSFRAYSGTKVTDNISLAGSAASTVWLSGDVRKMSKYALVMIHPAQYGSFGDSSQLAADAEMIQKVTNNVIDILVDVTGMAIEKATELVNATSWLNAEECLALGLATEIYDTGDSVLEELGITNGAVILNQVKVAPSKYQQVINKILIKEKPAPAPIINQMTKEEIEAIVNPNNSLMKKVLNLLRLSTNKIATNKGEMYVVGNLAVGSSVFNDEDAEDAATDATDVIVTNSEGKEVTLSIAGGKISNVVNKKEDDEDLEDGGEDDDLEADNKVVLNSVGIGFKKVAGKVDHKAMKNAMAKRIGESANVINQQNTLLVDLRAQLSVSNAAIQRNEADIRNEIKSEFTPDGSSRANKSKTEPVPMFAPTSDIAKHAVNVTMKRNAVT